MIAPRPYQTEAVNAILRERGSGVTRQLVSLPTGCHARGAEILMFDGSLKKVEGISVGDLVMGPDSEPREVLSLARGFDEMHMVVPVKGEPFIVNSGHMLSLKKMNERSEASGRCYPSTSGGAIVNISISEYAEKSMHYKHLHKLYRASVEFEQKDTPIEPYFLGVMLGDGSTTNNTASVTKPDDEIRLECYKQAEKFGLEIRESWKEFTNSITYFFVPPERKRAKKRTNRIREIMKELGLNGLKSGDKFIPDSYKINDRESRLELLAGLIDTDGSLSGAGFEYSSKSERLADDVVFVARSLGFAAYKSVKTVKERDYFRVSISGDCSEIPTRIPRKQASARQQKKDVLVTGFRVEPVGYGEYYGFQVDGDNLYLMGDFTATHNSGKTICFGMLAQKLGVRTLVLAHREELLAQAAQKMRLVDPSASIGILRAEDATGYYTDICVASVQTAARGKRLDVLKGRGFRLCVVDEAHHATAESYCRVMNELGFLSDDPKKLLVGVTATAYRGDGIALGEIFEKVVFERTVLAMIKAGYLCDARGLSVRTGTDLSDIHTRAGDFAINELSDAINIPARNRMIAESYLEHGADRRAVAFCCDVEHAQDLSKAFQDAGVACSPVWGDMDRKERSRTLSEYANGDIQVLTNCAVLTEGWDDPATSAVLLARPTKSEVLYTQMVGRGLRAHPGKKDCLVVDYADIAGRHSLCGLATLAGDPRIKLGDKETLLGAAEEFERLEKDKEEWRDARIGSVGHEEFDLFGRSDFVWAPVQGGHFRISVNPETSLWVRREPGGYMVWLLDRRDLSNKTPLSEEPLPLGYAQGVAEDYIRINAARHLVSKDAFWRRKPATPKQLETLARLKIPHDPDNVSSGDASSMIDMELARREAGRQEPATHKQIWFMRHKLGIDAPAGITKGEASQMIAKAKKIQERGAAA
jgi:superfamily II DNA or RNA helicase